MFTKTDIEHYFNVFKNENIFLIIAGFAAISTAMLFFFYFRTPWHRGFAIPLIVFGAMHCIAGYNNYEKTKSLRVRNTYGYDMNPAGLKTQELPRIKDVHKKTNIFIYINIFLLAAAVALFVYFRNKADESYYTGFATGLFLMTFITIGSSLYMQNKTRNYITGIEKFEIKN
jgi:hypothetical protein